MSMDEIPEGDIFLRENLSQILRGAERAKNLVEHILIFSRQGEEEVKPIRLEPIIEESLRLLRATLPATIEIIRETREPSGEIMGDPTQIHQVMMNLCTNAFHAMAESGGVLTVGVEPFTVPRETGSTGYPIGPGRYVKLSIRDTGHGIDSGNMDRIFDPYFTTKAQGKGTGLGLSVVHGIVKNYGGEIMVTSQTGAGALFEIFFPAVEPAGEDEIFPFHRPTPTGTEHILIVDDDGPIAGMMRKMLERLGYRVTACLGSLEALDIFTRHPDRFDLVITDLIMPKMTGVELAERILGIRPEKPIILCTGFSDVITEEDARKTGIREYIPKPVIRKDLARAVRRALDHESPN
jgi:CheY-like chemotaxis protein